MPNDSRTGSTFRVVVRGQLGDKFGVLFPGMRLERGADTTAVTGVVRDQAALQGLLQQLQELGLELVSVEQCTPGTPLAE